LGLSIDILELVLGFLTNLKLTQSEFGWKNYGQNIISAQHNSKSAVRNFEITVRNSSTHILPVLFQLVPKITDCNYWWLEHKFIFWKRLFIGIKMFLHSFISNISQHYEKLITSKKKRRTSLEKRLEKKNSRIGREIEDILGVLFLLLFSHVVLLFKYESLCNFWYDLWLDTLLRV
jgi:hypothetical protein